MEQMLVSRMIAMLRELAPDFLDVHRNILRQQLWRVFHRNDVVTRAVTHHAQQTRNCDPMIADWGAYNQKK
jgi:LPS sulfotransferase NodH